MIEVNKELCKGCKICERNCPIGAIHVVDRKAEVGPSCVECGVCTRACPFEAVSRVDTCKSDTAITCTNCPVRCNIPLNGSGACKRFVNENGKLIRQRQLVIDPKKHIQPDPRIASRPIITAVGAGSNYPDCNPAPHIICEARDGIDVVTVVTEAPISYSGATVKIDTDAFIGEEGDKITREGKVIGMLNTEEFGAKMMTIGGCNRLTSDAGFVTARTIVELSNGDPVDVIVGGKTRVRIQRGHPPVVNGVVEEKMRLGCGSGTVGLFASLMKECVDECIVIDHHIIGLASEHPSGVAVGMKRSGVSVNATKSSPGRYFSNHGDGVGGTCLATCRDVIKGVDMNIAWPGMNILTMNAMGNIYALFEVQADGSIHEIPMTEKATLLVTTVAENCEKASCSVLYMGATGGSARAGVCKKPLSLSKAVHEKKAVLTIGGAPVHLMPGGGINFLVDTEEVVDRAFTWVPTPATVAPVEYTISLEDYKAIGGHIEQIQDASEFKKQLESEG